MALRNVAHARAVDLTLSISAESYASGIRQADHRSAANRHRRAMRIRGENQRENQLDSCVKLWCCVMLGAYRTLCLPFHPSTPTVSCRRAITKCRSTNFEVPYWSSGLAQAKNSLDSKKHSIRMCQVSESVAAFATSMVTSWNSLRHFASPAVTASRGVLSVLSMEAEMIRSETEYQEAYAHLAEERNRLAEHRSRLREAGLGDREIKRVTDPMGSMFVQLRICPSSRFFGDGCLPAWQGASASSQAEERR
jgi:hypothetical protein